MGNVENNNSEYASIRVREIMDNVKYGRSMHIEIDWEVGEAPIISYSAEEYIIGKVE